MSIYDAPVTTLAGGPADLHDHRGKALLVVNVASRCGLTPQYTALEALHEEFADRGFSVLGFPCNQFGGQEPGTAEEIADFCSATYGVTFPMFGKVDVNGPERNPLYAELTDAEDASGRCGRRPVELREVPDLAGRRGGRPVPVEGEAGLPRHPRCDPRGAPRLRMFIDSQRGGCRVPIG